MSINANMRRKSSSRASSFAARTCRLLSYTRSWARRPRGLISRKSENRRGVLNESSPVYASVAPASRLTTHHSDLDGQVCLSGQTLFAFFGSITRSCLSTLSRWRRRSSAHARPFLTSAIALAASRRISVSGTWSVVFMLPACHSRRAMASYRGHVVGPSLGPKNLQATLRAGHRARLRRPDSGAALHRTGVSRHRVLTLSSARYQPWFQVGSYIFRIPTTEVQESTGTTI